MFTKVSREKLMATLDLAADEAEEAGHRSLADRIDEAREALRAYGSKAERGVFRELQEVRERWARRDAMKAGAEAPRRMGYGRRLLGRERLQAAGKSGIYEYKYPAPESRNKPIRTMPDIGHGADEKDILRANRIRRLSRMERPVVGGMRRRLARFLA